MGSSVLGFKLGSEPTEVSKQKRTNKSSCKGNNSGKVITKTPYVGRIIVQARESLNRAGGKERMEDL